MWIIQFRLTDLKWQSKSHISNTISDFFCDIYIRQLAFAHFCHLICRHNTHFLQKVTLLFITPICTTSYLQNITFTGYSCLTILEAVVVSVETIEIETTRSDVWHLAKTKVGLWDQKFLSVELSNKFLINVQRSLILLNKIN